MAMTTLRKQPIPAKFNSLKHFRFRKTFHYAGILLRLMERINDLMDLEFDHVKSTFRRKNKTLSLSIIMLIL